MHGANSNAFKCTLLFVCLLEITYCNSLDTHLPSFNHSNRFRHTFNISKKKHARLSLYTKNKNCMLLIKYIYREKFEKNMRAYICAYNLILRRKRKKNKHIVSIVNI